MRIRKRRKRPNHLGFVMRPAEGSNGQWSMYFVTDRLENGRQFRVLTLVDHFSRECPDFEAGTSMIGKSVANALERLSYQHPLPQGDHGLQRL